MGCKVAFAPLGEIASLESGGTPKKSEPSYWGGDVPWISAKTLVGDVVSSSNLTITDSGLAAGSRLAPRGSLLLLTRGSGLFNRIPLAMVGRDVAYNQDIKCIQSKRSDISPAYLFFALKALESQIAAMLETTGIGAGKLATDRLMKLPVPILEEMSRTKVEGFFSDLTRKLEINNRINGYLAA